MICILIWIWHLAPLMYKCKLKHKIKPPPNVGVGHWIQTSWEMPCGVSSLLLEGLRNPNPPVVQRPPILHNAPRQPMTLFTVSEHLGQSSGAGRCRQRRQRHRQRHEYQLSIFSSQQLEQQRYKTKTITFCLSPNQLAHFSTLPPSAR